MLKETSEKLQFGKMILIKITFPRRLTVNLNRFSQPAKQAGDYLQRRA